MTFSVNTNTNALAALQTLNTTQRSLAQTESHINTGYKINSAQDNASTFAIAQGMRADIAGLQAVQDSLSLGQATLQVANNAITQIQDQLTKLQALVVEGQNATVDPNAIQNGINASLTQINEITSAAQFNGVNLINSSTGSFSVVSSLNRTSSTTVTVAQTTLQNQDLSASGTVLGLGGLSVLPATSSTISLGSTPTFADGDTLVITLPNGNTTTFEFNQNGTTLNTAPSATNQVVAVNFNAGDPTGTQIADLAAALRQNGYTVVVADDGNLTLSSTGTLTSVALNVAGGTATASAPAGNPSAALTAVNSAINTLKGVATVFGTASNSLTAQADFVSNLTNTLTGGVSDLVDADLAAESASLQALQTKQQLGIQALSIANQSSTAVLALFK
jgi:flagellin